MAYDKYSISVYLITKILRCLRRAMSYVLSEDNIHSEV